MIKKIVLALILSASLLFAEDANTTKEDNTTEPLMTHTELGYIETQGNTNTKTFSLDFTAKKGWHKHKLKLDIDAQYARDSGVESKNSFSTELNYDYAFTKRFAFNYLVGYKIDKFSGFDSQFYTGPGAVYKILILKAHKWDISANMLYAQDEIARDTSVTPPIDAHTNTYASYIAKTTYIWQILDNLKFIQNLSYRSDFQDERNYFVISKSAIESKINGNFSLGLNYKIDYKNNPPAGKEYADRTFTASLIIDY